LDTDECGCKVIFYEGNDYYRTDSNEPMNYSNNSRFLSRGDYTLYSKHMENNKKDTLWI